MLRVFSPLLILACHIKSVLPQFFRTVCKIIHVHSKRESCMLWCKAHKSLGEGFFSDKKKILCCIQMPFLSCSTSVAFKIAPWVLNSKPPCSRQTPGFLLGICPLASLLWQQSKDSSQSLILQPKEQIQARVCRDYRDSLFFRNGLNTDVVKGGRLKTFLSQPCCSDNIRSCILLDMYFVRCITIHTISYSPETRKLSGR